MHDGRRDAEWETTCRLVWHLYAANPFGGDPKVQPEEFIPYHVDRPKPKLPKLKDTALLGTLFGIREAKHG